MKRTLLCLVLLSLFAVGAYAKKPKAPERQAFFSNKEYPLYGDVERLEILAADELPNEYEEQNTTHYGFPLSPNMVLKFNKRGDLVESVSDRDTLVWKYDSSGKMIESPGYGHRWEFGPPPVALECVIPSVEQNDDAATRFYMKYDSQGRMISRDCGIYSESWIYDSKDNLVRHTFDLHSGHGFNASWASVKTLYKYDSQGREMEVLYYNDGGLSYRVVYKYNSRGLKSAEKMVYNGGYVCYWRYDSRGNLVEEPSEEFYVDSGEWGFDGITRRKYDAQNRVIEKVSYASYDGTPYDSQGNLKADSLLSKGESYKYKYDSRGNLIEEACYNSDGSFGGMVTRKYDLQGNEIEEATYDSNGNMSGKQTRKYNSQGNKIEEAYYDSDGVLKRKDGCQYDSHGNLVKVVRAEDGKETTLVEYKITYYK